MENQEVDSDRKRIVRKGAIGLASVITILLLAMIYIKLARLVTWIGSTAVIRTE